VRIGGIKALFVRFRPIREFSGFPIISYYVNFQEFMSIFKVILPQMRKENGEKVQTFLFCTHSSIRNSPFISLHFGSSWLELDRVSFSRAQFWAQQGHFEGIFGYCGRRLNARKPFSDADLDGTEGGNRTHTPLTGPRILSPVRLPIPPPRHAAYPIV
jgi:hypothetical protein